MLRELDIHVINLPSSVQGAISVLERYSINFFLVDLELDYESGLTITRRLRADGISTIGPLKTVRKPYSKEQLKMALLYNGYLCR